jgi:TetR/AcrR family transcriptional repressor of nem operon
MAKSQAEKAVSRKLILDSASRKFREAGLQGVSVGDLMSAAGLTHGGFYGHFATRDELILKALMQALDGNESARAVHSGRSGALDYVRGHLTMEHCADPGRGCAVAALAGDVARAGRDVRHLFTERLDRYINWMADLLGGHGKQTRAQAASMISTLVGALVLSRASNDPKLSKLILDGARNQLESLIRRSKN